MLRSVVVETGTPEWEESERALDMQRLQEYSGISQDELDCREYPDHGEEGLQDCE